MSAHYAICRYDDATGSYIPLEVRPITDKLKNDDPLYQEGFQAGAASRDAEIEAQKNVILEACAMERAAKRELVESQEDYMLLKQERDQLRAELAAAIAACKVKDEALRHLWNERTPDSYDEAGAALAIQPDDAALKAWLGEPLTKIRFNYADGTFIEYESLVPLYSPKELK